MIDFDRIAKGEVRNISGHERGSEARAEFNLDALDKVPEAVEVKIPDYLDAITSSFLQGMFARSVRSFPSTDAFFSHYRFQASDNIMRQIISGVTKITTVRHSAFDF